MVEFQMKWNIHLLHLIVLVDNRFPDKSLASVNRVALLSFLDAMNRYHIMREGVPQYINTGGLLDVSRQATQMVRVLAAAELRNPRFETLTLPPNHYVVVVHNDATLAALGEMHRIQRAWGTRWWDQLAALEQANVVGEEAAAEHQARKALLVHQLEQEVFQLELLRDRGGVPTPVRLGSAVAGPVGVAAGEAPVRFVDPRWLTRLAGGEEGGKGEE